MSDARPGPWEFYMIELYIQYTLQCVSNFIACVESLVLMPASPMVVHISAL